ncbi:MAG: methionyl-tRNA formyltransferase [Cryomorphaceae bacterium]|jgi:methionyl-tRNA formyltransferase
MRITFLVNHDIAALLALNHLLPSLRQHQVEILYSDTQNDNPELPRALACLKHFDAKLVAQAAGLRSFAQLGAIQANDVNKQEYELLSSQQPDLIVSIRYMTILQQRCIDLPPLGVINLHSGALPNYQGVMASFWAMLNDEPQLATSLHWIEDATIDSGRIIARSTIQTDYEKSYLCNVLRLYSGGCGLILDAIDSIAETGTAGSRQQTGEAQYFSFPSQVDIDRATFKLFSSSDSAALFNHSAASFTD